MARIIRMPSEADLPPGTVRDFVELLFYFYKNAHRPTLRDISDLIKKSGDLPGTASTETIRRMLRGTTVPVHWETVDAVLVVLSDLAGRNPDGDFEWNGDWGTRRGHLERAWHGALDNPDQRWPREPARGFASAANDPWASDAAGGDGFSDEPPF